MIECIDEIILGISNGIENKIFVEIANQKKLKYIVGDEIDVLKRLIRVVILLTRQIFLELQVNHHFYIIKLLIHYGKTT